MPKLQFFNNNLITEKEQGKGNMVLEINKALNQICEFVFKLRFK